MTHSETPSASTGAGEKIKKLEDTLAMEQEQYRVALEYPTNTPQYYRALSAHGERIAKMQKELETLKALSPLLPE